MCIDCLLLTKEISNTHATYKQYTHNIYTIYTQYTCNRHVIDMQYTLVPNYTIHKEVVLNRKFYLTVVLPTKTKNKDRFPL